MSVSIESQFDPFEAHNQRPGLILAPYESCFALAMWFNEILRMPHAKILRESTSRTYAIPVPTEERKRILSSYLLFGKLDVLAGIALFESYMLHSRTTIARREFFGDFGLGLEVPAPFSHDIEHPSFTHPFTFKLDEQDAIRLIPALKSALAPMRAIYQNGPLHPDNFSADEAVDFLTRRKLKDNQGYPPTQIWVLCLGAALAIDKSVRFGIPLMSKDAAGPAWLAPDINEVRLKILKIVFEEVSWLPQPKSFAEAASMMQDERIAGLQADIKRWLELLMAGKLEDVHELRGAVRKKMEAFRGRTWASRINGWIAYMAIPTTVADTILGNGLIGIGAAGIGTASQFISDRVEKRKEKGWLSIGR